MFPLAKLTTLLLAWAAALWGVLQIASLPGDWGHWICGPWGCGPPVQALVACHGFWTVLIAPVVGFSIYVGNSRHRRWWGRLFFLSGMLGIAAIIVYQVGIWLPEATPYQRPYLVQRCLFILATTVDVPLVPMTLAGLALWSSAALEEQRMARRAANPLKPESVVTQVEQSEIAPASATTAALGATRGMDRTPAIRGD